MAVSLQKLVSRNIYAGETKNNLRNGYGIYKYSNKFFQYEGEWMDGRKHGHGKLVMADGTYYEGQFHEGEITGHGFKRFTSGQNYTGEFLMGEPLGHGVMVYANGMVYEGDFYKNQRSGYGIMRAADRAVYEGYFHEDKRHGDGAQTYNNGERYDGEWVADKRHGHGEKVFQDGSIYKGQFRNDAISGLGKMEHSSGVVYEGLWLNDRPRFQPVKLVIVLEQDKPLEVVQGESFNVKVECHDSEGNVVELDKGRLLQLTAGFKYKQVNLSEVNLGLRSSTASLDIEDVPEEDLMETPFGYTVVDYPINDCHILDLLTREVCKDLGVTVPTTHISETQPVAAIENEDDKNTYDTGETSMTNADESSVIIPEDDVAYLTSSTSAPVVLVHPLTFTPPPASTKRTDCGQCAWTDVKFSPPPVDYHPYRVLEAIKQLKKGKKIQPSLTSIESEEFDATKRQSDPKPGEYVLIVRDITDPPFMNVILEPTFAVINVLRKKKTPKKPKTN